ncbi:MAG: hypothetical protein LBN96_05435 [Desulfovibrio sp.]|jgi:hypothetical protein|nr:hypothetical protein [Desulfovibrio sp.]
MFTWQEIFSKNGFPPESPDLSASHCLLLDSLEGLKRFLDGVHIRHCLVKPYQENKNYPVVEARELLPSFDNDMFEYKELPGFAMVAFARQLDYFSETFQYERLHPVRQSPDRSAGQTEGPNRAHNLMTLTSRLPRRHHEIFRRQFCGTDVALPENYSALMPYLLNMDRAHVLALDAENRFQLAGVFASFPSDIDSELKRFGLRIGRFVYGDSEMYERNRMFVYQFLMELYGFPIVSERRTSSALFARKLHKTGERFLLRVLGQTDRTLTTYTSMEENRKYPLLEKIALVALDKDQNDSLELIDEKGFFLDKSKRVIILRVTYRQHRYDAHNLRQERALSVAGQEILHPLTGESLRGLNIIKDSTNMLFRLNDIVRGEHTGRIIYKRTEIVENTDNDEKRLKFLSYWLAKHQGRMIGYSDEFFFQLDKILSSYLYSPQHDENFGNLREIYQEVCSRFSYIQQARRVRILEDLCQRTFRGAPITYRRMMNETVKLLNELKFEIVNFFPALVDAVIICLETILHDRYIQRTYLEKPEASLSRAGREIRRNYGKLVSLHDSFKAVRKARLGYPAAKTAFAV